jgi:hypothetical protein
MATPKVKKKTSKIRRPYYDLVDSIGGFETATIGTDVKLRALVKKMRDLDMQIYKHLNANYIWD